MERSSFWRCRTDGRSPGHRIGSRPDYSPRDALRRSASMSRWSGRRSMSGACASASHGSYGVPPRRQRIPQDGSYGFALPVTLHHRCGIRGLSLVGGDANTRCGLVTQQEPPGSPAGTYHRSSTCGKSGDSRFPPTRREPRSQPASRPSILVRDDRLVTSCWPVRAGTCRGRSASAAPGSPRHPDR